MDDKHTWLEITDIEGLKQILITLNKYHNLTSSKSKSEAQKFREKLVLTNSKRIKLYAKKFGEYEYLVVAIIKFKKELKDTWIHADGIAYERDYFSRTGNTKHDVFSIICMKDLYDKGKAVNLEPIESKKTKVKK